jgi:TetR/AcrR family transcriptional repressor of bet genes
MGRKSVARERRLQIIQATIECMSRHGVSGTTLERVAEIAGMARGHVRHFVGNREDLLVDAARAFFFGPTAIENDDLDALSAAFPLVPDDVSIPEMLDELFGAFAEPTSENAGALAFVDAARTMPAIQTIVVRAYTGMQESLYAVIEKNIPQLRDEERRRLSYGLLAIAIGNIWLIDVTVADKSATDARAMAEAMIAGQLAAATE